jgi:hypothetical protein
MRLAERRRADVSARQGRVPRGLSMRPEPICTNNLLELEPLLRKKDWQGRRQRLVLARQLCFGKGEAPN